MFRVTSSENSNLKSKSIKTRRVLLKMSSQLCRTANRIITHQHIPNESKYRRWILIPSREWKSHIAKPSSSVNRTACPCPSSVLGIQPARTVALVRNYRHAESAMLFSRGKKVSSSSSSSGSLDLNERGSRTVVWLPNRELYIYIRPPSLAPLNFLPLLVSNIYIRIL